MIHDLNCEILSHNLSYLKLKSNPLAIRFQPSTSTKSKILNGSETMTGDNMNMPSESKILATVRSIIIKGIKSKKPI